ncbi:MAG TPA: VWA domain-containing protein [Gaiellaceae bacterium]|nr:VWA domain-containing protein [Gaiellaceae bacterium]
MSDAVADLTAFGRALRAEGFPVGTGRVASFCRAAALLSPGDLYWAGRATLVARREQIPVYDRVFRAFFGSVSSEAAPERPVRVIVSEEEVALASDVELLRQKSFARCSAEELAQLGTMMEQLGLAVPMRRSRRLAPARAGLPDLRRTLRRSFRTGGEPLERRFRTRRRRKRRLVLLLDVSGSMADYSHALLVFAHAAMRADRRWEAFCFGTRLTRLTRALAVSRPDEALARAAEEVVDWNGGTRIGESLKALLDEYGHRGLVRGAVVVLCSDGLEVGDPELLAEQMARLSRLAYRVIWLNPLKGDEAYEPLARGMHAALPYVDLFAAGHNLASLEELGSELSRLDP